MDVPIEHGVLFLIIAAVAAFFMAFNNVANSFASAVGSKAIAVKQALLIAALLNMLGAVLLGGHVATKLVEGVINPAMFPEPTEYIAAMFAVLLAAGTFVLVSTLTGLPVSSSHSIVGSLVGVGIVVAG